MEVLDENWEEWMHHIIGSNYTVPVNQKKLIANKIKEFYFGGAKLTSHENSIKTLVKVII